MIPLSCAASSASATWRAQSSASATGSGPRRVSPFDQFQNQDNRPRRTPPVHRSPQYWDGSAKPASAPRGGSGPAARGRARTHAGSVLMATSRPSLRIVRPIYLAHAAGAQRRHDPIRSELPARRDKRDCRLVKCRRSRKFRLVLPSPAVARPAVEARCLAACITEECLPRFRRTLQSRVEELLYSPPAFLVHRDAVLAVSQCYSTFSVVLILCRRYSAKPTSERG